MNKMDVTCSIITISDTRDLTSDLSGQLIETKLIDQGFSLGERLVVKDDVAEIRAAHQQLAPSCDALILNGGTGIAKRDVTFEAVTPLLVQEIPGFGELFRYLSYKEIGSHAMASRALAGFDEEDTLLFCLPGSQKAGRLGMEALILPELVHLLKERRK